VTVNNFTNCNNN